MDTELKRQMHKRMPKFRAQDSHKKVRVRPRWRKPRGMHSKIRLSKKGYNVMVSRGYRTPVVLRGMNRHGRLLVHVDDVKTLSGLKDAEVIIGKSVGLKNRIMIIKEALRLNLFISGLRDPQAFLAKAEASMQKKKEEKVKRYTEKEQKQKDKEAKAKEKEEKEKKAPESAPKDQKEEDKKEMEKIITMKE
ncbi:MAG: eL32 family ribosomal protein [Nanoarchaeota archaeon]